MIRALIAAATLAALSATAAHAATAASAPAKTPAHKSTKAAPKAPAAAPEAPLTAGQLSVADRVLTGMADCELGQKVDVVKDKEAGHFDVTFNKKTYHMVPEETTTGAVKLIDHAAQAEWLQIPAKSMLLDNKAGKRLATECKEQGQG